jgi:5-formyltetrahydrofolate cyclo-ligase
MPVNEKKELRLEIRQRRKNVTAAECEAANKKICSTLKNMPELSSRNIAAFISDGSEPDFRSFLDEVISNGQTVILPRSNPETFSGYEMVLISDLANDLVIGAYGILEPIKTLPAIEPEEYDRYVWLVPGVAFDAAGARLGRGKGVYDRLLGNVDTLVIGVFFEYQKGASVPVTAHDRRLALAVTEQNVYRFR